MTTTARVLTMLERLQNGGTHTVGDLARDLGVDERTVRRYADHLLDLGVPVEARRGRYGGYRIAPGYRMPPLMLTDDEAVSVFLALGDSPVKDKLRRVLPARLSRQLAALEETAAVDGQAPAGNSHLLDLAEAAHDRRPVEISYLNRQGRRTERTLHPHGIVAHGGHWYVTGEDSSSHETRTFRLDRITAITTRGGTFTPPGTDPTEQVLESLAATPWKHAVRVRIDTTEEHARTMFPRGMATIGGAGPVTLSMRAERLDWIAPRLAALDRPFVVEEPAELREHVRALADRLKAAAGHAD